MGASRPSEKAQKKTSMKVLPRLVGALVLVMILAPEGLAAQDAIATALDRIHREYSSGPMDTARLVLLDRELRELIPHYSWQERPWLRATYLKVGYESIGVHSGLANPNRPEEEIRADFLIYSGELLAEAHSNDPNFTVSKSYSVFNDLRA